ncbi:MAG TPA: hypothetical protein VGN20_14025 [Mucilaginibacter sp.]|jgi:hypothetical protein
MVLRLKILLSIIFSIWGIWSYGQRVPLNDSKPNQFFFILPNFRYVSAGAYNSNNQLVATIFSHVWLGGGSHKWQWDAKDDAGNTLTGTYKIKILSDSVTYTPNGGIGNTSDSLSGSTVHHAYSPISDMVQVGSKIYCALSFNEGGQSVIKIDTAHPNQKINLPAISSTITGQTINNICTDSTLVYIAAVGYQNTDNFVYALKTSNDLENVFSSGSPYTSFAVRAYASVIDKNLSSVTGNVTGIAVQKSGNYLLIAHSGQNQINEFNKTTGALIRTISITTPGKLKLENDSTLWVAQGTSAEKYTVNTDGTLTNPIVIISGFQRVAAISTYSGNVYIEDGGTNQYISIYNSSTGALVLHLLQPGGYVSTSVVSNDRVYIEDLHGPLPAFITHLSDGSLWTGDPGNQRSLHFNSSGTFIGQIAYLGHFYSCNAIGTRVFDGFLEFSEDYSQPIQSSWALTHNYGYSLPTKYYDSPVIYTYEPLQIFTLSNGGTYCIIRNNAAQGFFSELTATGLTKFGTVLPPGLTYNPDGTFSTCTISGTTQVFKGYAQTGYSGRQPILSEKPTTLASYDLGTTFPRAGNSLSSNASFIKTPTNKLIVLSPNYSATRPGEYHLGAYNLTHNWVDWKTGRPTFTAYSGTFPQNERFDIGNSAGAQAGSVAVLNSDAVFNFHGENWKAGQSNFIEHFNTETGLMIGQAGTSTAQTAGQEAVLGMAGNTLTTNLVSYNGTLKVLQNDEARRSEVVMWTIANLSSIHIDSVNLTLTNKIYAVLTNHRYNLLAGNAENVPLVNEHNGWTRSPTTDFNTSGSYFNTLVRKAEHDLKKAPDVYVKASNISDTILNQGITRLLPRSGTATDWQVDGALDLSIAAFQSDAGNPTTGTGKYMYFKIGDTTNKALAVLGFVTGNKLTFNGEEIFTGLNQSAFYAPMEFTIKSSGSKLYFMGYLNGVTYTSTQSIYDGTADITRPKYTSVNFQFHTSGMGPGLDIISLFFSYQ